MGVEKNKTSSKTKPLDPKKSVQRTRGTKNPEWSIVIAEDKYT
jgi:hypothetical protein